MGTADESSTSDKNLVNFGPVIRVLQAFVPGGLHAGLCHAFLVNIAFGNAGQDKNMCQMCKNLQKKTFVVSKPSHERFSL